MKKVFVMLMVNLLFFSCDRKANYSFVGDFDYVIENLASFENSVLSGESFGYGVGDFSYPGLKILGVEDLPDDADYVVVYNYSAEKILVNSKRIRDEGFKLAKRPIEVVVNKNIKKEKVFIYRLDKKGAYRLLLP